MTIPGEVVEEATKSLLAVWPEAHVELSMGGQARILALLWDTWGDRSLYVRRDPEDFVLCDSVGPVIPRGVSIRAGTEAELLLLALQTGPS